jgi:Bacterial protein of unknown function (DUF899)
VPEEIMADLVTRAPYAKLAEAGMPYTDTLRGDWPGISAFLRVGGEVYHTYSTLPGRAACRSSGRLDR